MARKRVVDLTAATATLSKNQSGSLIVLSRAAGMVVTLPSPGRGLEYDFVIKTDNEHDSGYRIATAGTPASLRGSISVVSDGAALSEFQANGLTHTAISLSSLTTGGLKGTKFRLVCDNDGVWEVTGKSVLTSLAKSPADPFLTA